MDKLTWVPRGNNVIVKAILKPEKANEKISIVSETGEYYAEDYLYYVHDVGEEVSNDLSIGDEVFLNLANLKVIHGVTNRKEKETYFFTIDGVITLRRPGPQNI